jgi:hypothetical protein
MSERIAGVGAGLFALIFVTVVAILIGVCAAFVKPDRAVPIAVGVLALPLLVFGFIMAAPTHAQAADVVVDPYYVPRIIFFIVMALAGLAGPAFHLVVLVLGAPEYTAPDVSCRRKRLTALRPAWIK